MGKEQTDKRRRMEAKLGMVSQAAKLRGQLLSSLTVLGPSLVEAGVAETPEKVVAQKHRWTRWRNWYRLQKQGGEVRMPSGKGVGGHGSRVRVRNRCPMSHSARSTNRRYGVGRHHFRIAARRGSITGLRKSSW